MKNTDVAYQKSNKIFHENMTWLMSSDIRIKNGHNKGALYGWKNLNPVSFPFIYSEITGYAITSFCWLYSELGNLAALKAAKECSEWIIKNRRSYLLVARPSVPNVSNNISNMFYSFDNGMIMIGLLNLYKITKDSTLLFFAERLAKALIERFFDGEKFTPRLDEAYNPINSDNNDSEDSVVKWSTISGAYHSKLSMGLLELSIVTSNSSYALVSDSVCDYAKRLQKSSGQFITNPGSDIVYLHPHLYACEGLIYSGLKQSNDSHYTAGLEGIKWAVDQLCSCSAKGLRRDTRKESVEQSDCTAQLLRLLTLTRFKLKSTINTFVLDNAIERLHSRLLDFYIPAGQGKGGMRYQLTLDSACSWCTMFSMQALGIWNKGNSRKKEWIDYFI
jgi:hypothetical protein